MNILTYGDIKLIDAPEAKQVADEVITNDCYRIWTIPKDCTVIDVGAFYGEFAIACHVRGFNVLAFEPSPQNYLVFMENLGLVRNVPDAPFLEPFPIAVWRDNAISYLDCNDQHPSGSKIGKGVIPVWTTNMDTIMATVEGPFAVKLDCEGAERDIFRNLSWLGSVNWLAMEWHDSDGDHYANLIREWDFDDFEIEMSCEGTNSGGILHARRI